MCRALLYLGEPVLLDNFLYQPDSALVRQTYMPKMLSMLNLAGFGLRAWDPASHDPERAYAYYSRELPVFDRNLKNLAEKIRAGCLLAHVRGVPYHTRVEIALQNCHPFHFRDVPLVLAHNGELVRFAEMRPLLSASIKPGFLSQIHGTTDSEWVYALLVSQLPDPRRRPDGDELATAVERTVAIMHDARRKLGIGSSSALNLFIADGTQLAAVRYCFDYGCYPTDDAARLRELDLSYLSLWYTAGRDYGLHDGEWKMTGGSQNATSVLIASEPLTRDTAAWVEVPEYAMLHATIEGARPAIRILDLD
jgi:predicted glutamine amidotransferase